MTKSQRDGKAESSAEVRCAIYTRKSSEEGLQQEFNSLDAQRESSEAYIKSQVHEGWTCVADRYDDGGFTGGNMDRPALKRLIADIEAGKINVVCCYKVDRLSRSIRDFSKIMETFEQHNVAFVAITQMINTATSMGRLMLNVLMSFAQFERELVSERTRDKIAAARRKGKWSGGHPILGYDVDPKQFKLVVNNDEAKRVQAIFKLYLEHESLLAVVTELDRRTWRTKAWTTRKGRIMGGNEFTKNSLYGLLTNVAYIGKVSYKTETHKGEHEGIIDPAIWQRVQAILQRNGLTGGAMVRNKFGAFLKGLIRCVPCSLAMVPSHSTRNGNKRYRYYVCCGAQKRGWHTCPSKAIPAGEIERFVVDQIRSIGKDPAVLRATMAQLRSQTEERVSALEGERRGLGRDVARWNGEVRTLATKVGTNADDAILGRLADFHERLRTAGGRVEEINGQIKSIGDSAINEYEVEDALAKFDLVWQALTPREQSRIVQLLIERIDYDGASSKIRIHFHPTGIKALANEFADRPKELIA